MSSWKVASLILFAVLMSSFVAAGSFYDFLERLTGRVPLNDPNNSGDAPGENAQAVGLVGEPEPPRCGDGVCETAEAHADDNAAVYCPKDCGVQTKSPNDSDVRMQGLGEKSSTGVVGGPGCQDSDGGADPKVYGETSYEGLVHHDACYSPYRVEEFFCVNGVLDSQVFPCLEGACVDGRCVEMDIEVATTYPYVPATSFVQKIEVSTLGAPLYLSLLRDEPRSLGNVQLTYQTLNGKSVLTLSRSFELKSNGYVELDGKRFKVSVQDHKVVLTAEKGVSPSRQISPQVQQPLAGRQTFFKRIASTFRRA